MKLTTERLKRLIREELEKTKLLQEFEGDVDRHVQDAIDHFSEKEIVGRDGRDIGHGAISVLEPTKGDYTYKIMLGKELLVTLDSTGRLEKKHY